MFEVEQQKSALCESYHNDDDDEKPPLFDLKPAPYDTGQPTTAEEPKAPSSFSENSAVTIEDTRPSSATIDDFLAPRSRLGPELESLEARPSEIDGSVPIAASCINEVEDGRQSSGMKPSYVIGHLPIAPIGFESRKSRLLPEVVGSRDEIGSAKSRAERDAFTSGLAGSILSPETKFSGYKIQVCVFM